MKATTPSTRTTGPVQSAKQSVTNMIRFIARHRGISLDEAWREFAHPAVNEEFEKCVKEGKHRQPATKG